MASDPAICVFDSPSTGASGVARALPSPVTDAEKQEKLSHSMKLAFENIPWKGPRPRNTPLGVTGAMRMRSPKVTVEPEPVVTPLQLSQPSQPSARQNKDTFTAENQDQLEFTSLSTVVTTGLPTAAQSTPAPLAVGKAIHGYSKSTPNSPAVFSEKKRRKAPTSILSIKSAGLIRSKDSILSPRPATSTEPQSSKSRIWSSRTVPIPRPESSKSPGIVTSTVDMKSPSSRSIISISSKKSFMSLRSAKSTKSPSTPDSNANASPRERGFKYKINSGLGAIKEHALPKRTRTDNSAPPSAKDVPLPTPAYDKKRFDIRPPVAPVPETPKFWTDQHTQPGTADTTSKAAATAAYNANHILPFRQYAKSPTVATMTTTITAGGS